MVLNRFIYKTIMNTSFDTLVEAIDRLKSIGYDQDFTLKADSLYLEYKDLDIHQHDFHIDQVYRFDGMTNPDDESILYAISLPDDGLKGLLIGNYGPDSDPVPAFMIEKLAHRSED